MPMSKQCEYMIAMKRAMARAAILVYDRWTLDLISLAS